MSATLDGEAPTAALFAHSGGGDSAVRLDGNDAAVDAEMTRIGRADTDFAALASAPPTQENFERLVAYCKLLHDRLDRTDVRWQMAARLYPPFNALLPVPLGRSLKLDLQRVASPNVQAERGGA